MSNTENREFLVIECSRTGYSPTQIRRTMTVAELRDLLEDYPDDMPIVTSHDGGYTYGGIDDSDFRTEEYDENDHRVKDSDW